MARSHTSAGVLVKGIFRANKALEACLIRSALRMSVTRKDTARFRQEWARMRQ